MTPTPKELVDDIKFHLEQALEHQGNKAMALDYVESAKAGIQALHLTIWHQYHRSGEGPTK